MTWKLVRDSSSDLVTGQLTSTVADFEVVPLCLRVGEKEFWDTAELDVLELLDAMAAEKGPCTTACPSPEAFAEVFRKAERTICTTISQNLSGTYQAACLARDMVLEEFPEKKIAIIDSFATAGEEVLILRKARELIEEDPERDFDELAKTLYDYQQSLETVFTLECFDNLVKNGRMKPLVGTLLQTWASTSSPTPPPRGSSACGTRPGARPTPSSAWSSSWARRRTPPVRRSSSPTATTPAAPRG